MKAIYFHDPMVYGGADEDRKALERKLENAGIPKFKFKETTLPPFDEKFDLLFFDWGGMSVGNSIMESFCRHIYTLAQERPGVAFVMESQFTKEAMVDAIKEFGDKKPDNIFLTIEEAKGWILTLLQPPSKKKK